MIVVCMISRSSAFVTIVSSSRVKVGGIAANVPRATARPITVNVHARERPLMLCACADAGLDQDCTPLVDALAEAASKVRSPLFYPGHKMGRCDCVRARKRVRVVLHNRYLGLVDYVHTQDQGNCDSTGQTSFHAGTFVPSQH